jgi:hypothetical protein
VRPAHCIVMPVAGAVWILALLPTLALIALLLLLLLLHRRLLRSALRSQALRGRTLHSA